MVVSTKTLFPDGIKEGFIVKDKENLLEIIVANSEFKERGTVEEDEIYQQIVAQIILIVRDKIFIHRIPASGNESRLHEFWPIFLGGHVNSEDTDIAEGVRREFKEEIDYKGRIIKEKFAGLIKLHDNAVNKVHVGLVWIYYGNSENFMPTKDGGLCDGRFVEVSNISSYEEKMTYWSRMFLPHLKNYL